MTGVLREIMKSQVSQRKLIIVIIIINKKYFKKSHKERICRISDLLMGFVIISLLDLGGLLNSFLRASTVTHEVQRNNSIFLYKLYPSVFFGSFRSYN